jgi:predicted RNase H-like nuclease (RuvC/YqgF family)
MYSRIRLALALMSLVITPACYLAADGKDLERQVTTIAARQQEFLTTFEVERDRLQSLADSAEDNIERLTLALDEAQQFLQRNNADLGARVADLERQINSLRGALEEADHLRTRLLEEVNLLRAQIEMLAAEEG